jgi:uncharacterized damage-inducible protein DinB
MKIVIPDEVATRPEGIMSPDILCDHWQGHRRLTRRLIEAFPEEKFFTYSLGGMRPCAKLVMEMIRLAALGIHGLVTRDWEVSNELKRFTEPAMPATQEGILRLWDEVTDLIDDFFEDVQPSRLNDIEVVFGQFETPVYGSMLYWIENEVHHRGQAYVYLRSLGIEPPAFW